MIGISIVGKEKGECSKLSKDKELIFNGYIDSHTGI